MRSASRWISVVLHPVFMPLYTVGLALWVDPHLGYFLRSEGKSVLLAMLTVMTVAFPLTSTLLLLKAKLLNDLTMPTRQERIAPFLMTLLYYGMTYYLLRNTPLHPVVLSIFAGIILATSVTTAITLRWKISIHMVGMGGALGAIAGISALHSLGLLPLLSIMILLAGILGTARLLNGAHTAAHVYAGMTLGFIATYGCVVWELAV